MVTVDVPAKTAGPAEAREERAHNPFAHILVALDGSGVAESVLEDVVPVARAFGSSVTCLCAHEPIDPIILAEAAMPGAMAMGPLVETQEQIRQERAIYLTSIRHRLERHGIAASCREPKGRAAEAIVTCARRLDADLIAMTTHGRSGLGRALLGSVADEVIRTAPCPVLLVRRDRVGTHGEATGHCAESAVDAGPVESTYGRIVVPLDGSELAEQILTVVLPLVRRFGSKVILVTALGSMESSLDDAAELDPDRVKELERGDALLCQERTAYLTRMVEQLRQLDVVVGCDTSTNRPADAILHCAHAHDANLIAMTTHGSGGLTRALVGSVAADVLHHAPCPVLLVRSRARE
jgi:nucleotide-binding universal stress UspA family protein